MQAPRPPPAKRRRGSLLGFYAGPFEAYTAEVVYAGPGRLRLGVSQSMLFCPYRAGGVPPAEANRSLPAWLREPEVAKSWQAAIRGRRLECDCGLPHCHVEVVAATLPREPMSLRPRSEWRSESLRLVRQVRQGQQISHVLLQILDSGDSSVVSGNAADSFTPGDRRSSSSCL